MKFNRTQVKREIANLILSGQYREGQPLPTVRELAQTFKIGPNTAQEAVHALVREGLIISKSRKGLFVNSIQPRPGSGNRIGLVFPNKPDYLAGHPWPGDVLDPLRSALSAAGYSLELCALGEMNSLGVADQVRDLNLAGLMLFEVYNDRLIMELRELRLPMVALDYDTHRFGVPCVAFDNAFGTAQATQFLIQQGHREIVLVQSKYPTHQGDNCFVSAVDEERASGYEMVMKLAGFPVRIKVIKIYDLGADTFENELDSLFSTTPIPTALVCVESWPAYVLPQKLQARGLRVPEHVSMMGFGNERMEFGPGRRISSVCVDLAGMGAAAAALFLKVMKGGHDPNERVIVPAKLMHYDSVAAPFQGIRQEFQRLAGVSH